MRHSITLCLSATLLVCSAAPISAQGIFGRLKKAAEDKAHDATGVSTTDTATPPPAAPAQPAGAAPAQDASSDTTAPAGPVTISSYQNYDFTPGDTIIFADDFTTTQDGEFPDQWSLGKGQAVVNKQQGFETFTLTDGNYVKVIPRVKNKVYLGPQFTVEYDTFFEEGSNALQVFFENGDDESYASVDKNEASFEGIDGSLPAALRDDNFTNRWHHIAIAVKNGQMKIYVDQYRVLTNPSMKIVPQSLQFGGLASQEHPLIFTNLRVASGGGMNLIGQKFTEAKIVTHGINFDIDKATLRPESMGTLNQIKRVMTDNPDLKFEVGGYTDNTGASAHNLTLSQQRADAVKAQLVSMGIASSRLTAKGYGDTNPIADNATPEGKANNRRVEFVKTT